MTQQRLTVAELIEALRAHRLDAEVILEGCDCTGKWNGKFRTEKDQNGLYAVVICRYGGVGEFD